MFKFKTLKAQKVFIIGCSNMGAYIADIMSTKGANVFLVDKSKESFKKLTEDFSGFKYIFDGTDTEKLVEIGIQDADIVLVVTDDDNVNSFIAQYVSMILQNKLVITRIYDIQKKVLLADTKVKIIFPSILATEAFFDIVDDENKEVTK